jgi:hypothetical protein
MGKTENYVFFIPYLIWKGKVKHGLIPKKKLNSDEMFNKLIKLNKS